MRVDFAGFKCRTEWHRYMAGGAPAICLVADGDGIDFNGDPVTDGEPVATATINIPGLKLAEGYVLIKDYSENEGIVEALVAAGVVTAPTDDGHVGKVCALTPAALAELAIHQQSKEHSNDA